MTEPLTKEQLEAYALRRWPEGLTEVQRDDPGLCLLATIAARDAEIERLRAEVERWSAIARDAWTPSRNLPDDDPGLCLLATVDARDAEIERLRAIIDGAIIISRADIQAVKADLAHRFPLALDEKIRKIDDEGCSYGDSCQYGSLLDLVAGLRSEIERLSAQVAAVRASLAIDHGAHSRADYMVLVQAARAALGATPPDDTEGNKL